MKILFIINMEDLGFEEPLGVLYLAAVCKKNNHKVYAVENNLPRIEKEVKSKRPDLIAVSVLTPSFSYLFKTVSEIKSKFDIPIVFGGPHATFFPEIIEFNDIDYVFRGEGEEAFVEFLNLLERGEPVDEVSNLVFREAEGKIKQNPLNPLIKDLDILPFPEREIFHNYKNFYKSDVRSVIASRGCPFNCSYCYNNGYQKLYGESGFIIRTRSINNVIEECLELRDRYKAKVIHFFDDIFPYRKDWIEEFSIKYKKKVNLPFLTNTSFEVCSEHYISCLSKAGCMTLLIGVETGNEGLRKHVLFRRMNNKDMIEKANLIHSYDIKIYTQNLIGIPHGSLESDLETMKLNIDLKADYAGAYICQAYPKTALETIARDANLIDESVEFGCSFYYLGNLLVGNKKQLEKLRVLFPIAVNFPILYYYMHLLLKIPALLFILVKMAGTFLHGYKIKTTILRYRMGFVVFLRNTNIYFKRHINRI